MRAPSVDFTVDNVSHATLGYDAAENHDPDGDSDGTTLTVYLEPSSGSTSVSVNSITYSASGGRYGNKHMNITVALVDDLGNPVGGASVSIDLYLDEALYISETGTTETDGNVIFSLKEAPSGCYRTDVTSVSTDGLIWDGATPLNEWCK